MRSWRYFVDVAIVSCVLLVYLSSEVTILSLYLHSSSGASVVAIDNKIEQAMVSHPVFPIINIAYPNRYFVYMPQAGCRVASVSLEWIM